MKLLIMSSLFLSLFSFTSCSSMGAKSGECCKGDQACCKDGKCDKSKSACADGNCAHAHTTWLFL